MELKIDMSSITPVYEQIVQQIKQGVMEGDLASGINLPAIRKLSGALGLNQNTVAKAYKLLEQQNVTINRGRKGTCVHEKAQENIFSENQRTASAEIDSVIISLQELGMAANDIASLLHMKIDALKETH